MKKVFLITLMISILGIFSEAAENTSKAQTQKTVATAPKSLAERISLKYYLEGSTSIKGSTTGGYSYLQGSYKATDSGTLILRQPMSFEYENLGDPSINDLMVMYYQKMGKLPGDISVSGLLRYYVPTTEETRTSGTHQFRVYGLFDKSLDERWNVSYTVMPGIYAYTEATEEDSRKYMRLYNGVELGYKWTDTFSTALSVEHDQGFYKKVANAASEIPEDPEDPAEDPVDPTPEPQKSEFLKRKSALYLTASAGVSLSEKVSLGMSVGVNRNLHENDALFKTEKVAYTVSLSVRL